METKGFMDQKSQTKLKRMVKYFPAVRVDVVRVKDMAAIEKSVGSMIHVMGGNTRANAGDKRLILGRNTMSRITNFSLPIAMLKKNMGALKAALKFAGQGNQPAF